MSKWRVTLELNLPDTVQYDPPTQWDWADLIDLLPDQITLVSGRKLEDVDDELCTYGEIGPLTIMRIFARDLRTGDILMDTQSYRNLVVTHTYPTAINQFAYLDGCETDPQDPDPLQSRTFKFEEELVVMRVREKNNG